MLKPQAFIALTTPRVRFVVHKNPSLGRLHKEINSSPDPRSIWAIRFNRNLDEGRASRPPLGTPRTEGVELRNNRGVVDGVAYTPIAEDAADICLLYHSPCTSSSNAVMDCCP